MKLIFGLVCLAIQLISISIAQQETLKIVPELTNVYLIKGSNLKIDCIYSRPSRQPSNPVDFYHGLTLIKDKQNGFGLTTSIRSVIEDNSLTSTITLTKNNTDISDRGVYKCELGGPNVQDSKINVEIFEVTQDGDTLVDGMTSLNLLCEVRPGMDPSVKKQISWSRNDKVLSNGEKYKIYDNNNTLEILNPERSDMGEYICEVVFLPGTSEEHRVKTKPIFVKAPPTIDAHSKSKNMVQGEDLELTCKVSGYPFPSVRWLKDDQPFNTSTRIHLLEYEGSPTGKLTIYSLEFEDKGKYSCEATSSDPDFKNNTAVATMNIRVKDKLAALWPFLGIVAEVIVLCAIILIYEKKKSKQMSDDDDSPDTNLDEKKDHKDVRHRRT